MPASCQLSTAAFSFSYRHALKAAVRYGSSWGLCLDNIELLGCVCHFPSCTSGHCQFACCCSPGKVKRLYRCVRKLDGFVEVVPIYRRQNVNISQLHVRLTDCPLLETWNYVLMIYITQVLFSESTSTSTTTSSVFQTTWSRVGSVCPDSI